MQEKAIAHPTDARLYLKSIHRLIKLAGQRDIELRQSYVWVSKKAFFSQSQYARAGQYKRAAKRSAIEPTIGHVKSDNRMGRNYLQGVAGDMIKAILSACGYNMRKLLVAFLYALLEIYEFFVKLVMYKAKVSAT